MKAAVAVDGGLVVRTVGEPVPAAGEVLVATRANGICGSDLQAIEATKGIVPPDDGPFIVPGHEFCAEIVDHGPGADDATRRRWPVGSLVCANPFVGGYDLVGATPRRPGGLGQVMVLPTRNLLPVPPDVAPEHAALAEPLAVGIRAVVAAGRGGHRGPYAVVGCGPIGLAVIVALRAAGLGPIVASDLAPARRALAERLGADVVVDAGTASPFDRLAELGLVESPPSMMLRDVVDGPLGPTVFECVGTRGMLGKVIEGAPRHSHLVIVGVCHEPDTLVPLQAIVKEVAVDFVLAYRPAEFAESLRRITERVVDVSPLITAAVGLDEAPWAVTALRGGDHAKILVLPQT